MSQEQLDALEKNAPEQDSKQLAAEEPLGTLEDLLPTSGPEQMPAPKSLTRGQQVMSVSFNPGQREDVAAIKQIFADAFDEIDKWVTPIENEFQSLLPEDQTFTKHTRVRDVARLAAIAKTNLETSQMYAIKAITR